MIQRTSAAGISRQGRAATGVRVMNLKEDDLVSAAALVVDTANGSDNGSTEGSADGSADDTRAASASATLRRPEKGGGPNLE